MRNRGNAHHHRLVKDPIVWNVIKKFFEENKLFHLVTKDRPSLAFEIFLTQSSSLTDKSFLNQHFTVIYDQAIRFIALNFHSF